jgi:hypothetical protein
VDEHTGVGQAGDNRVVALRFGVEVAVVGEKDPIAVDLVHRNKAAESKGFQDAGAVASHIVRVIAHVETEIERGKGTAAHPA